MQWCLKKTKISKQIFLNFLLLYYVKLFPFCRNPNGIKRNKRGLVVIRDHRQGPDLAPDHDPDLRIIFAAIEKGTKKHSKITRKNSFEIFISRTSDKRRKKKKRNRKSKSKSKSPQCLLEDEELVTTPKENHPNLTTASEDSSVTIHNLKEDDKKDDEAARLIFQLKSKRCTTAKNVFAQGLLLSLF